MERGGLGLCFLKQILNALSIEKRLKPAPRIACLSLQCPGTLIEPLQFCLIIGAVRLRKPGKSRHCLGKRAAMLIARTIGAPSSNVTKSVDRYLNSW